MNPQQQAAKKFDINKFHESLQTCAHQIKNVCDAVSAAQPFGAINGDHNKNYFAVKELDAQSDALSKYYDTMETMAYSLPAKTPVEFSSANLPLSIFSTFVTESEQEPSKLEVFNETSEATDYLQYLQTYSEAVSESLASFVPKVPPQRQIYVPLVSGNPATDRSQRAFDEHFVDWIKKTNVKVAKSCRLSYKFLEQGVAHSLIEFLIESKSVIKALLLVNNGQVDYINLYSNHEKYSYINDRDKIDVFARSKFEIYSSLTSFVNNQLQLFLQSPRKAETYTRNLDLVNMYVFELVNRANQVSMTPCKICKKHLKNGMPPTHIDLRHKAFAHQECRGYSV